MDTRQSYIDAYKRNVEQHGLEQGSAGTTNGVFPNGDKDFTKTELLRYLSLQPHHHLVDIGCSVGRLPVELGDYLAESGQYLGLDLLEEPLTVARAATHPSYQFKVTPGFEIPLPGNSADFVVFFSVFTHLHHHESYRYLLEAKRVTKPSGKIVFTYLGWNDDEYWQFFENNARHSKGSDPILLQPMSESQLIIWARHLGLDIQFLARRLHTMRVAVLTTMNVSNEDE